MSENTEKKIISKNFGMREYTEVWHKMRDFTAKRDKNTPDEIWLLEHFPVFTQGMAGKPEHILAPGEIPVVQTDRGGQVTYHGPGQLMAYVLLDLRRNKIGVRDFVSLLENSVIALLADYGIIAIAKREAPGVYVQGAKICSIGLRIRNGCSYHGIALNVKMDLAPFARINPCGFKNLKMVQMCDFADNIEIGDVAKRLNEHITISLT